VLQQYAIERFLYRISKSTHAQGAVLQGAPLLKTIGIQGARPTMDIDRLRGKGGSSQPRGNRNGPVLHLLLRYTQALITQMAQTAVCNRHDSLDQQLCRWLLLSLDRLEGSDLVMTQELIANMLGVRRERVTEAATNLQRDGLIRDARGHIRALDRAGLEKRACECYAVVRREYARLLPKSKET
jgi:Crp-like helix-turn-helix protein